MHSVADGVVVQAGRNGSSGNLVEIRHTHLYTTYYLHLSRFNGRWVIVNVLWEMKPGHPFAAYW